MTTETITLRNTISKVPWTYPADYAKRLLADPNLGKVLEVVDTEKVEVLGQPRIDGAIVDDEGNPITISAQKARHVVVPDETASATETKKD